MVHTHREVLWEISSGVHGLLIEDKGYLSQDLTEELSNFGIDLQTPLRQKMKDERPQSWVKLMIKTRRLIETVIGQLQERFNMEKVWGRDTWHLTSRFYRKILAHTMGVWLNRHSHDPLGFDELINL